MFETTVDILNPSGLHARPAALFVQTVARFRADVRVANAARDPDHLVNAKSILGVLGLGVSRGHRLRIVAEGDDAEAAIETLTDAIREGLGEVAAL